MSFTPDKDIFGNNSAFDPYRLYSMSKAKAYLFGGVEIRWHCALELISDPEKCPSKAILRFPEGLRDYLDEQIGNLPTVTPSPFAGKVQKDGAHGSVEWAISWVVAETHTFHLIVIRSLLPKAETHEQGLRAALTKGLKAYGQLVSNKKADIITADDVMGSATALVSVFIREPEFQGQTKDKLATPEAARIVESALRDHFEHYLTSAPQAPTNCWAG